MRDEALLPGTNQDVTSGTRTPSGADVLIIGAGLPGLCSAASLVERGVTVLLLAADEPGRASPAAAGMLAPGAERSAGAAHRFALAARDRYPALVDTLADATGVRVPLNREGILEVALDGRAAEAQRRALPASAEWLDGRTVGELEPALAHASGATYYPTDGFVDNVALIDALHATLAASDRFTALTDRAISVSFTNDALRVRTESGATYGASVLILAAGAWATRIEGLPRSLSIEPVRGEMIALAGHALRRATYGPGGYVVPRGSDTLVGATMERVGFDASTTERARLGLAAAAAGISPLLARFPIVRQWAGIRPMTPDGLPLLGRDPERPQLLYACGHSRNGILLAPLTGDCMAALAAGDSCPYDLSPFAVTRFDSGD